MSTLIIVFAGVLGLIYVNNAVKIADGYKQPNFLFLMVDSMDGRVIDPTDNVYGGI